MVSNKITRTFGKKVRIGRLGLPLWAIGLAVMGMAAVAGQAVGPVLAGSVTGSAALTVNQTVLLDTNKAPTVAGDDDSVVTMNDERTAFSAGIVTQVGQLNAICIYLENNSGKSANAMLELVVPAGMDVEVQEYGSDDTAVQDPNACATTPAVDNTAVAHNSAVLVDENNIVNEAQLTSSKWTLTVAGSSTAADAAGGDDNDGIQIRIESKDDLTPGYYVIKGRIIQVSG